MASGAAAHPLYSALEAPVATLYAEVAERSRAEALLLPGTPGSLVLRPRPGNGSYWYRRYYASPGTPQLEAFVGREDDESARRTMQERIDAAEWIQQQVRQLRHLGLQVGDKGTGRVLVELHNRRLFDAGLVMVGTLAFMAWLNELGVKALTTRTHDIDLARRQALKLAAPTSFLETVQATGMGFFAIPGIARAAASTSAKVAGREGLRVDLLTWGPRLGEVVPVPELDWHAQAIPHFDYLLDSPRRAAMLAGGHCVPVQVPAPERLAWHKLYSSTRRTHDAAKADKDLRQASTLLAVLVERDDLDVKGTVAELPRALLDAARRRLPSMRPLLARHAQGLDAIESALAAT